MDKCSSDRIKILTNFLLNSLVFILALIGSIVSFRVNSFSMLKFYTVLSNLFGMIASCIMAVYLLLKYFKKSKIPNWVVILKYSSTCCLTLTFLVVVFVLSPSYSASGVSIGESYRIMLFSGDMLYMHFFCPILSIVSFMFFDELSFKPIKSSMFAIIPTVVYAVVVLILNIAKVMRGPYIFFYVYEQSVIASIAWFFGILLCSFAIDYLIALIGSKKTALKINN